MTVTNPGGGGPPNVTAIAATSGWGGYTAQSGDQTIIADATGPAAPTGLAAVGGTGGTLSNSAAYGWVITAVVGGVESVASQEIAYVTQFSGNTQVALSWTNPAGTTQNRIYRTTQGGQYAGNHLVVAQAGAAGAGSYTDTGVALTAGSPPAGTLPITLPTVGVSAGKTYQITAITTTVNQVIVQPASGTLVTPGGSTAATFALGGRNTAAAAQSIVATWDAPLGAWILSGSLNSQNTPPASLVELSNLATAVAPVVGQNPTYGVGGRFMTIDGGYAYIQNNGGILFVVDISTPGHEQCVGGLRDPTSLGSGYGLRKSGNYVYIAQGTSPQGGLTIIDVSNPSTPVLALNLLDSHLNSCNDLEVVGHYCYVSLNDGSGTTNNSIVVFDIANPTSPVYVTTLTDNTNLTYIGRLAVRDGILWSLGNHLTAISLKNPAAPTVLGSTSAAGSSGSFALAVTNRYAYVADHNASFKVVDISNPTAMTVVGSVLDITRMPASLGAACAGRYVYVCNQAQINGLTVVDVIDPTNPRIAGTYSWGTPGEHVVTIAPPHGRYLHCVAGDGGSFHTMDLGASQELATLKADALAASAGWVNEDLDVGGTLRVGRILSPDIPLGGILRGRATLVAGTVSIANPLITANSVVTAVNIGASGTVGALSIVLTAGTGFAINSTNAADTSRVRWEIDSY